MSAGETGFINERHVFNAGALMGDLMKHDVDVRPVVGDDGEVTPFLVITIGLDAREITVAVLPQ